MNLIVAIFSYEIADAYIISVSIDCVKLLVGTISLLLDVVTVLRIACLKIFFFILHMAGIDARVILMLLESACELSYLSNAY